MKYLLLIAFIFVTKAGLTQQSVKAIARDSTTFIQWGDRPEPELDDPDLWILNICAFPLGFDKASSTLPTQGTKNYSVKNLGDDDPRTAWIEGKSEYGLTESIEKTVNDNITVTHTLVIYNGYQNSIDNFKNNSRVKTMGIQIDGEIVFRLELLDVMGRQDFDFQNTLYDQLINGKTHTLKFVILDVYPGLKYKDTAISEMFFQGC